LLHQKKNLDYFLGHDPVEAPLALQLGGNSVEDLGGEACAPFFMAVMQR
jgi:tRNA-dihydrouridine synthase A